MSVLFDVIKSASASWQTQREETRWGRMKVFFAKMSRSADDHSDLLAIIPSNDKYTSLVAGSMSAIVQVWEQPFLILAECSNTQ